MYAVPIDNMPEMLGVVMVLWLSGWFLSIYFVSEKDFLLVVDCVLLVAGQNILISELLSVLGI